MIKRATEGSILAERTNQGQRLDMMKEKASQNRETILASIQVLRHVARRSEFFSSRGCLKRVAGSFFLTF